MIHLPTHGEALGWRKFLSPSMLLAGVGGPAAGVPAPPASGFDPLTIFGMQLWLRGDGYDGSTGIWTDRSALARNATQGTSGFRPIQTGTVPEINVNTIATFDGADDYVSTGTWTAVPQPLSILAAVRATNANDGTYRVIAGGQVAGGDWRIRFKNAANTFAIYPGTTELDGPSITKTRFSLLTTILNGVASIGYKDSAAGTAGGAGTANLQGVRLGSDGVLTAGTYLDGSIADFFVYSISLGAMERYKLENLYAAARYAMPTTFNPAGITGLAGWWKGDTLGAEASSIATWTDQSGNSKDFTASGTAQPTVRIGKNGKKYAEFDGTTDYMTANSITNYRTIIAVGRWRTTAATFMFDLSTGGSNSARGAILQNNPNTIDIWAPNNFADAAVPWTTGNVDIIIGVGGASSMATYFNGAAQTTEATAIAASTATKMAIGARTFGDGSLVDLFAAVDIYELLLYTTVLTASERQQVEGYLANKYAINAAIRPFDPLSISGCQGWWQVDGGCDVSTDGSSIGTLYDRSGLGHNLVQATAGNKPLYKTNRLNSLSTALFDGVDDYLKTLTFTLAQPTHVFLVFKQVTWGLNDGIFDGNSDLSGYLGQQSATPNIDMYAGSTGPATTQLGVNAWAIGAFLWNNASSKLVLDGVVSATGTTGASSMSGFTLGNRANLGGPSNIEVAEAIVYNVAVTDQDRKTLEAYLANKYAIGYKAPNDASLLANLAAWYDTSQDTVVADGTAVSSWTDRSGNARHATQGTGANQPKYYNAVLNGRPVLRFDGSNDSLAAAFTLAQPKTIFVVVKSAASGYILDSQSAGEGHHINLTSSTNVRAYAGSSLDKTVVAATTGFHVIDCVFNGATSLISFDGQTSSGAVGSNVGNGITIGADGTLVTFMTGDIAEIAIFNTNLSDANRRAVENYLAQKYAIAV